MVHVGVLYRRAATAVRTQAREMVLAEPGWQVEPARRDLVEWFEGVAADLVSVFRRADPDAPAYHWFGDGARVWMRAMARETALHRWDTENAHGDAEPLDADLAADAVDELLEAALPAITWRNGPPEGSAPTGERFHFHRTDGPGEWLVTFTPQGLRTERAHAKGDIALRGTASDLLLFMWHRIPADRLEVFGDQTLVARWIELAPGF